MNVMRVGMIMLAGGFLFDLAIGVFLGIRVLIVATFLVAASEILWDWFKRGKDYASNSRFNYVFNATPGVIAIILVTWYFLLPHHPIP